MAQSTELSRTQIITQDGIVTATVVDKLSPDRMSRVLFKGFASSKFGGSTDETDLVSRDVKDLIVFPFSEL